MSPVWNARVLCAPGWLKYVRYLSVIVLCRVKHFNKRAESEARYLDGICSPKK